MSDIPVVATSRYAYTPDLDGKRDARSIERIFTNGTRCLACRRTADILVVYDPGCADYRGKHFHRFCTCGATWVERSWGHAGVDISLDDPRYVPLCWGCGARHDHLSCMKPTCCTRPQVEYHDTASPCVDCEDLAA